MHGDSSGETLGHEKHEREGKLASLSFADDQRRTHLGDPVDENLDGSGGVREGGRVDAAIEVVDVPPTTNDFAPLVEASRRLCNDRRAAPMVSSDHGDDEVFVEVSTREDEDDPSRCAGVMPDLVDETGVVETAQSRALRCPCRAH